MNAKEIYQKLAAPFPDDVVRKKAQVVKGDRALAIHYITARDVMERLTEVVGMENWYEDYKIINFRGVDHVQCTLAVKIDGGWVLHQDVGSVSESGDSDDRLKAAYSDALKRAAVKFGVGAYLYYEEAEWERYDPVKKKIVQTPRAAPAAPASRQPPLSAENGVETAIHMIPSSAEIAKEFRRRLGTHERAPGYQEMLKRCQAFIVAKGKSKLDQLEVNDLVALSKEIFG